MTLPSKINTTASESQPYFTGTRLYMNRDTKIVYHDYIGSGGSDYNLNSSWGNEVVVLQAGNTATNSIYGVGEPTIATINGKTYLYFVLHFLYEHLASGLADTISIWTPALLRYNSKAHSRQWSFHDGNCKIDGFEVGR